MLSFYFVKLESCYNFASFFLKRFFLSLFIYCERESHGGAEREGERESQAGSTLSVQSPTWGSSSQNYEIMTWTEIKSWSLNWLRHPGTPPSLFHLTTYHKYFLSSLSIPQTQERCGVQRSQRVKIKDRCPQQAEGTRYKVRKRWGKIKIC